MSLALSLGMPKYLLSLILAVEWGALLPLSPSFSSILEVDKVMGFGACAWGPHSGGLPIVHYLVALRATHEF